ncbi:MAG: 50S ribosomal protein L19 [Planctomycetes bacterium]|nr:50S ribosomal protein L19 [Planctomycetota bacterium]
MNSIIAEVEKKFQKKDKPGGFQIGDNVDVHVRIIEGDKERVQIFSGTVIKIKGRQNNLRSTFTVRRIVSGEGVERVFPYHSPSIVKVEVRRTGKARRAKLYFLRDRVGKATKVKERREEEGVEGQAPALSKKEAEAVTT